MKSITIAILIILMAPMLLMADEMEDSNENVFCDYCKKPIFGEYIKFNNKYYHPRHFMCYYCKKPIDSDFSVYDGQTYHKDCYQKFVAKKCALCGAPIEGEFTSDNWGNDYCWKHVGHDPQCFYCQRFISEDLTGGGQIYADGRKICNLCYKTAVTDLDNIDKYLTRIFNGAQKYNFQISIDNVAFDLESLDSMNAAKGIDATSRQGLTSCYTQIKGDDKTCECTVYVLNGLPEYNFIKVLAHELMHVWINQNTSGNQDKQLSEGSAEYFAYLIMSEFNDPTAVWIKNRMFENRYIDYSDGLEKVKNMVIRHGVDYWLGYIKENTHLP